MPFYLQAKEQSVNIYSFRKAHLIAPLLHEFTLQTGIKVNVVTGQADKLIERLIQDGDASFADLLLTNDVSRLERAKELNLLQAVESKFIDENIPTTLREKNGYWFALSLRARAIFYAKNRIDSRLLQSYQDLAHPRWRGKICSRKGEHPYNRTMVASFIALKGFPWAKRWVKGFSDNLAMRPHGGDKEQLRKLARGNCDIAIANSYYFGQLARSEEQRDRDIYQQIGIILPHTNKQLSHVNISGAAVTKAAKNKYNAIRLIEFLSTPQAQQVYAQSHYEYPIRGDIYEGELLHSWGKLADDTEVLLDLYPYHQQATKLINKHNW